MIGGTNRGVSRYTALLAFRYAEPVGSVRPKFPTMDNINGLSVRMGGNMPLLCPAQGFPVPSHRYDILNRSVKCLVILDIPLSSIKECRATHISAV